MKTDSLSELVEDYDKALKWLSELTTKKIKGRFLRTREILQAAAKTFSDTDTGSRDRELANQLVLATPDIRWLIDVYSAFVQRPIASQFVKELEVIQKGPVFAKEENPDGANIRARNIHFELVLAGLLTRAGFPAINRNGTHDGSHQLEDVVLLTECKRMHGPDVGRLLKQAIKQIENAKIVAPTAIGLIAIDATKILNDGSKVIQGSSGQVIRQYLLNEGKKVIESFIQDIELPDYILAVKIYFTTAADIDKRLTLAAQWTAGVNPRLNPSHKKYLEALEKGCQALEY